MAFAGDRPLWNSVGTYYILYILKGYCQVRPHLHLKHSDIGHELHSEVDGTVLGVPPGGITADTNCSHTLTPGKGQVLHHQCENPAPGL